jgi:hypothetical protein
MNTSAVAQMLAVGQASFQLALMVSDGLRLPVSPQQAAIDAFQQGADDKSAELPATVAATVDVMV